MENKRKKQIYFIVALLSLFIIAFIGINYGLKVKIWMVDLRNSTNEMKMAINNLGQTCQATNQNLENYSNQINVAIKKLKQTCQADNQNLFTLDAHGEIVPVEMQYGIPKEDLEFLKIFWKPILTELPKNRSELRERIKTNLQSDFNETKPYIAARYKDLTERDWLMLHLMLRVNGSMPIYIPRIAAPKELDLLLTAPRGNCTDYAIRLCMVLDAFDIPSRIASIQTPSLPGHVAVEAYDATGKSAYLMDSTLNAFSFIRNVDTGFWGTVFAWDSDKRQAYFQAKRNNMVFPPLLLRFLDPGITVFNPTTELNLAFVNNAWAERENLWRQTLANELPEISKFWQKYPDHAPREIRERKNNKGIMEFNQVTTFPPDPLVKSLLSE